MHRVTEKYGPATDLVLGVRLNERVPEPDQRRQRSEAEEILRRLCTQPGVILADEVGMGKTFVALAVAYSVAIENPTGPVVVMVPANLVDKWEQDLSAFCELYLENRSAVRKNGSGGTEGRASVLRYGVARHSVDFLRLLDDPPRERCHLVLLAQGAMGRSQTDKWVRLALIAEALRRHGRGRAIRLIQVKEVIHRFLAELIWAIGEERAHEWGDQLWQSLLRTDPQAWREVYNDSVREGGKRLLDDPVPKAVVRSLDEIDLSGLAEAMKEMPVRARGGDDRVSERIGEVRRVLRSVEGELWKQLLAVARWRSPLLVMDEAHHLKNPATALARQLQSPDLDHDLRTGDGAMARVFDRMLFLTATPFQLGHHELVRVLERFRDVRWDERQMGRLDDFSARLAQLSRGLTESQRSAIALQQAWSRLRLEDCQGDLEDWWNKLLCSLPDSLTTHQRAVIEKYQVAKCNRDAAAEALQPWIVRHNKGILWTGTSIKRRHRLDGAEVLGEPANGGLVIPPNQLLPFFLAARSAVSPSQDLLGEALCSSYEAFRLTRNRRVDARDDEEDGTRPARQLTHADWYLGEFDRVLKHCTGTMHPKVQATVRRVVDEWENGEKVLVFAFYRHTCRALWMHIGREIERRIELAAQGRLREGGREGTANVNDLVEKIHERYFDKSDSPGRRALDYALEGVLEPHSEVLAAAGIGAEQKNELMGVMRRFLRVPTTLVRCFPLAELDSLQPGDAIARLLDHVDASRISWRQKFETFVEFLVRGCSRSERMLYIEAGRITETGRIHADAEEEGDEAEAGTRVATLANVRFVTGKTKRESRSRLMRAFNTPFFPDILVCSQVMAEGVDLQRFCRHVLHHDLDWNPSTIEQRTGRIDRLNCKAEGRHPIVMYLPYIAGTADERQYRVMSDREQWFRVVMGQDEVARLISADSGSAIPLPEAISNELGFRLGLET